MRAPKRAKAKVVSVKTSVDRSDNNANPLSDILNQYTRPFFGRGFPALSEAMVSDVEENLKRVLGPAFSPTASVDRPRAIKFWEELPKDCLGLFYHTGVAISYRVASFPSPYRFDVVIPVDQNPNRFWAYVVPSTAQVLETVSSFGVLIVRPPGRSVLNGQAETPEPDQLDSAATITTAFEEATENGLWLTPTIHYGRLQIPWELNFLRFPCYNHALNVLCEMTCNSFDHVPYKIDDVLSVAITKKDRVAIQPNPIKWKLFVLALSWTLWEQNNIRWAERLHWFNKTCDVLGIAAHKYKEEQSGDFELSLEALTAFCKSHGFIRPRR